MTLEEGDTTILVRLEENLAAENVADLRERLLAQLTADKELLIDMTEVALIDSAGLGVLISTQNSLSQQGRQLVLRGVNENIRKMMKLMRLDRHFRLED